MNDFEVLEHARTTARLAGVIDGLPFGSPEQDAAKRLLKAYLVSLAELLPRESLGLKQGR